LNFHAGSAHFFALEQRDDRGDLICRECPLRQAKQKAAAADEE
jgi:hypothetical protein